MDIRLQIRLGQVLKNLSRFLFWKALCFWWLGLALLLGLCWAGRRFAQWDFMPSTAMVVVAAILGVPAAWAYRKRAIVDFHESALKIEEENPQLHAALLTAIEQQPDDSGRYRYLQRRVIHEALDHSNAHYWAQNTVARLTLMHLGHAAALAVFLALAFWTVAPNRAGGARAASRITVDELEVTPGDAEIERGTSLVVMARFPEPAPSKAELVIKNNDGTTRRMPLSKNLDDPVFGGTLTQVSDDMRYQVAFEDQTSPEFQVKVFDYPELTKADAALDYPDYTKLEDKKIPNTRRITAVEGTQVEWTFEMNKPIREAYLVSRDETKLPLEPDPQYPHLYRFDASLLESDRWKLYLTDAEGRSNKTPDVFFVDVLSNKTPKLKITFPSGDMRVTAIEEMRVEVEAEDDFGLESFGLAYMIPGEEEVSISLGNSIPAHEAGEGRHIIHFEQLNAEEGDLVNFYAWGEDYGADGEIRRAYSEMLFAEVRPFEEIFRQNQNPNSSQSSQQSGSGTGNAAQDLMDVQKQIINATWNLKRAQEFRRQPTAQYVEDVGVIHESQQSALSQLEELQQRVQDEEMAELATLADASMNEALKWLEEARSENEVAPLNTALGSEQKAFQALLQLQAREFQVSQGQQQQGGGGGGGGRSQRQLDELELSDDQNRYETQRQAQTSERNEQTELLNRLKELAQRQNDLNQQLQELQTALQEAETEEEQEDIRRRLKRLREEQQEMLQDIDGVQQQMAQSDRQRELREAREQLDRVREEANQAAEDIAEGNVSQALASGARVQEELNNAQQELREQATNQFAEEMRDMRQQARELSRKEQEISEEIGELKNMPRSGLQDSEEYRQLSEQIQNQLASQNQGVTNLLGEMRDVIERAEDPEPLLSQALYDTLRSTDKETIQNYLNYSRQMVERKFLDEARTMNNQAAQEIDKLTAGVERAAESILGNDLDALQLARSELQQLQESVEREMSRSLGQNTNSLASANAPSNQGNQPGGQSESTGDTGDQSQQEGSAPGNGESSQAQSQSQGQGQGQGQGQPGEGSSRESSEQSETALAQGGQGDQPGQGQQGQGQQGQGQQGQGGQGESQQAGNGGAGGNNDGNTQQADADNQRGGGGGGILDQLNRMFGGGSDGGGGTARGPLTGDNFRDWADRLSDVEEMLDVPEFREQVMQLSEEAWSIRGEFTREGKEPKWDLVEMRLTKPMAQLRKLIGEEILRRENPENLVPLDRDPVPSKYSELVRKYYEQLGRSE